MLHIIHPYIYKLKGDSLTIGPIEDYTDRDRKLSDFVGKAIKSSYPIMCHERSKSLGSMFEGIALKCDDLFEPLFDSHVSWIGTDTHGLPIQNKKPSDMSDETWREITETTITHNQFSKKMGNPNEVIVCGGEYNRCERNFMKYIDTFHTNIKKRFYIPELSVIIDKDLVEDTTNELEKMRFKQLSYEQALEIIS